MHGYDPQDHARRSADRGVGLGLVRVDPIAGAALSPSGIAKPPSRVPDRVIEDFKLVVRFGYGNVRFGWESDIYASTPNSRNTVRQLRRRPDPTGRSRCRLEPMSDRNPSPSRTERPRERRRDDNRSGLSNQEAYPCSRAKWRPHSWPTRKIDERQYANTN